MPTPSTAQLGPRSEQCGDPDLLAALAAPTMYRGRPPVAVHETHASWVFVAGDRAYKIKKPVALGFLDYSTLSRRHAACLEEVRINRELAPGIYLRVLAVVRTPNGFRLTMEDTDGAIEYAVEMQSFHEADTMEGMIVAGTLTPAHMQGIARRLASFHGSAPRVVGGGPSQVLQTWQTNIQELGQLEYPTGRWDLGVAEHFGEAFVNAHAREIEQRVRDGHVRDGHGDLRCEHVLVRPAVCIVDRIEFDPALRCTDVAAEVAFLTMDLEAHGQAWAARELVGAYVQAGGSAGSEALRSFYSAHRALVRAKVTLLDAAEHESSARVARFERAERLWALAERLCWRARRPLAIVVCGAAASGKSTLAGELSRHSQLPVVSSDVVRKHLAGLPAAGRSGPEHYTEEFTHTTYDLLGEEALEHLRQGGVIVDATCHSRGQRGLVIDRLKLPGSTYLVVQCQTTLEVALRRAAERLHDPQRISDATPQIAEEQFRAFEELDELPYNSVLRLDTDQALDAQVAEVTRAMDRRGVKGEAGRQSP